MDRKQENNGNNELQIWGKDLLLFILNVTQLYKSKIPIVSELPVKGNLFTVGISTWMLLKRFLVVVNYKK